MNAYIGPLVSTAKLKGSSYKIKHRDSGMIGKRHAAHLPPFPDKLLPFLPVDISVLDVILHRLWIVHVDKREVDRVDHVLCEP